jgi:antitoxin component YwqK of YwqJK toxin-antitoxin module
MKLTTLILLFFTISSFSQEIKYSITIEDPCSERIEKGFDYCLEKNGIKYCATSKENRFVILPDYGEYKLTGKGIEELYIVKINKLVNSETFKAPKIREYYLSHSKHNYLFRNCDTLCNGIETDYYSNGKVRLRAEFENGIVVGELKKYYRNGKIKEVSIYDKDGFLRKKTLFTENGEIKNE